MTNVVVLANIAALRAYTGGGTAAPAIWIQGYTNPADGGEGMFTYVASDTTSADNSGTIIVDDTGATSFRYHRQNSIGPLNLCWFGAPVNTSTDSSTALNAALAALPTYGGEIFIPPGTFTFLSAIDYSMPSATSSPLFSLSLVGSGLDATVLYWPNQTSGIQINAAGPGQSIHIRDMSITTGVISNYGALALVLADLSGILSSISDITRVSFRGKSPQSQYWNTSLYVEGLSNVNYVGLEFIGSLPSGGGGSGAGICVSLAPASGSFKYSLIHNFIGCNFYSGLYGLAYSSDVQGVTLSQCNFGSNIGIFIPGGGAGGLAQLGVMACQFGCTSYPILIQSPIGGVSIIGNAFYYPTSVPATYAAIFVDNYYAPLTNFCISGNTFNGSTINSPTGVGIRVQGVLTPYPSNIYGVVNGNVFTNMATGIDLTGAEYWNVYGNIYGNVTTQVVPGTATNSIGAITK